MSTETAVERAVAATPPLPYQGRFRQLVVDTGYNLLRFPLGLASFVLVVTGLSAGAGLVVVWVGVAVLASTLVVARGLATVERAQLPAVLRRPVPHPAYSRSDGGRLRRLFTPLRDPQCWLDALHALLAFPVAVFGFDVVRRLTSREREVLGLMAEGHSNTAIARMLVVTPGAVEKHTQHIFAKLGLAPDEDQHRRVLATLAYLRS